MKLAWSQIALNDFENATDYIAQDDPTAAKQVAKRIDEATKKLCGYPYIGHPGADPDQREWMVQRTPYLLIYEIHGDTIYIARVWHTRRQRENAESGQS